MRLFPVSTVLGVFVGAAGLFGQGQTAEPKEPPGSQVKGVPPRAAATDYQAQAKAGDVTIAADFLGHAIPRMEGPLMTEDYVVVEAGLFGPPGKQITLSIGDFSLRINGKKQPLPSAPYELVAKSVKDPQWSPPAPPEKSKSSFGSGSQNEPPPAPVHMPFEMRRAMAQHLQRTSMPQGEHALPQAGLLYFQHRGKRENIRSVELVYASAAGKATLTLQP
ncbi:MAG TPA: hypothetical protein VGK64_05550 [Bryobacteraceae bacterium]